MKFSVRATKADEKTRRRPRLSRPAAAAAIAGALAVAGPATAASAATQAPYQASASSAGTRAAAACAPTRPHSDTILYKGIIGGLGQLTIQNEGGQDAVVVLVLGHSRAIAVYVRTKATATVSDIKDGTYTAYFSIGSQYHACTGRFASGASYGRFSKSLAFVTTSTEYTTYTMTLEAAKGNTPVTPVSPPSFPAP